MALTPESLRFSLSAVAGGTLICLVGAGCAAVQKNAQTTHQVVAIRALDGIVAADARQCPDGDDRVRSANPADPDFCLKRDGQVTIDMVTAARAFTTRQGEHQVELSLTPEGADRQFALTVANVGQQIAIVVNGVVWGRPRVMTPIFGDESLIGSSSEAEAQSVADAITASIPPRRPHPKFPHGCEIKSESQPIDVGQVGHFGDLAVLVTKISPLPVPVAGRPPDPMAQIDDAMTVNLKTPRDSRENLQIRIGRSATLKLCGQPVTIRYPGLIHGVWEVSVSVP